MGRPKRDDYGIDDVEAYGNFWDYIEALEAYCDMLETSGDFGPRG